MAGILEGLPVPYAVIQVQLDCGVRLFSNPAGVEANAILGEMHFRGDVLEALPLYVAIERILSPVGGVAAELQ